MSWGGRLGGRLSTAMSSASSRCVLMHLAFVSSVAAFGPSLVFSGVRLLGSKSSLCQSPRFRTAVVSLRASAASNAFDAWLQQNGARSACTVSEETRTLVAKEELRAGAEVCSIPAKLFITLKSAQDALGPKADELDAETAIALFLIAERAKGAQSFWHPWLSLLPNRDQLNIPLFWPDADFRLLQGTKVAEDTEALKEALTDEFDQLARAGWVGVLPKGAFTLDAYEWAIAIVRARALRIPKFPGEYIIAPGVDFAGHAPAPAGGGGGEVAPSLQYEGMFREPRVRLAAAAAVRRGGAVGYPRAGLRNGALLSTHGVADPAAAAVGEVGVSFSVSPMDRFHDDKVDIFDQQGLAAEQTFALSSEEPPAEALVAFLRLVCIQGADAFLLESVFRNEVWEFMQQPVSRGNEELVLSTLSGFCQASLDTLTDTTDSDDLAVIADPAARPRAKAAAAVKIGERRALLNTLEWVRAEQRDLDYKEYYQERRLKMLKLDRPIDESEIVDPDLPIRGDVPWLS